MSSSPRLTPRVRETIASAQSLMFVSAATAWEMATKFRLGKLDIAPHLMADFRGELARAGFVELDVTVAHGLLAGQLEDEHKDPFDRMLIAQARTEGLTLISNESAFDRFGIARIW